MYYVFIYIFYIYEHIYIYALNVISIIKWKGSTSIN